MSKLLILAVLTVLFVAASVSGQKRYVSITIDDLPVVSKKKDYETRLSITERILKHIVRGKVPVTGFVNEKKLYAAEKRDEKEIDLLRKWLDAGCDLANHTYSHLSLHDNPVEKFNAEILQGEVITKELLAAREKKLKYFRHPYLATGLSMETKAAVDKFLAEHGYTIAPVSIDTSDWAFAAAYDKVSIAGDTKLKKKIGKAYVPYMELKTDYWERQSVKLFGREIKQILLIHANEVNADYLDDVIKMYRKRGYEFVSLDEALSDEAYKKPDTFTRRAGISWLHRWALDEGREFIVPDEPKVPKFVMNAAGLTSE